MGFGTSESPFAFEAVAGQTRRALESREYNSAVVARYLYGVMYEPRTLRLALTEAAQGDIGSSVDQLLLYCFHYDANQGRYVLAATTFMRLGGGATALILGLWLFTWWRRSTRRENS